MEVRNLYTLLAIVSHRSFAEAGKAVGLSTSGVSLQVRALEQEFGLTLFDRSTRPPKLTPEGQTFVARAREMVAMLETMSEGLRHDAVAGVLELGAVHTVVSGVLPPALKRLRARVPTLQIRLTTGLSHELEPQVARGALDAAVITQTDTTPTGLVWQPFCAEPLVVVAASDMPGETDRELLEGGSFVRFQRVARVARRIDDELMRRGIRVKAHMEVDTLEGIFSLVANGLGVSVVPRRRVPNPFPPGVRFLPFGQPPVTRQIGILQRQDNPRRDFVRELFEELVAASGEDAGG